MAVNFFKAFCRAAKNAIQPLIVTPDNEELAVLNDMGEVVIGSVAHVCEIDGGRFVATGSIDHVAKCGILITFSAWLYHEIGEPPVEDRIERVDMNLIEAAGGLAVWLKESIRIIRITEDICGGTIASDELVFPVVKLLFELGVEQE